MSLVWIGWSQTTQSAAPSQPALREELLELRSQDQAVRTAATVSVEKMIEVDERNTARLKEIIARYGWPTKAMVGWDGADAAWLLAQHADRDPAFQL